MSVGAPIAEALAGLQQACTRVIQTGQALLHGDTSLELAHALFECGVVIAARSGLAEHAAVAMTESAETLNRLGRPHAALRRADDALRDTIDLPDYLRASAYHARARAHDLLGDSRRAGEDLERAQQLDPATPARWMLPAQMAVTERRWDDARAGFLRTIAAAEASGDHSVVPQAFWELAQLDYAEGDRDGARGRLEQARNAGRRLGDLRSTAYAELGLANLAFEEGDMEGARFGFASVRALVELLPEPASSSVALEHAAAPSNDAEPEPLELDAPAAAPPVLRIVFSPPLREHVQLELWSASGAEPDRCIVPFRFLIHPRTEERLRWYAEDYRARPLDPGPSIAAEVEQELTRLGAALFREVLDAPAAAAIAAALRRDPAEVRIEVAADATGADGIPWELLRDPAHELDIALAARALVRTTTRTPPAGTAERAEGPMRILLVIARPDGRLDVPFRSVAGPLVRELAAHGASIATEVLRPPTFEQLTQVLRAAHDEGRPFDLMHFDGHGVFDARQRRSYLVFEAQGGGGAYVTGELLGTELHDAGVPVLVMHACRSAHGRQEQAYGSVAREALDRGVDGVVAMRYDVHVATASDFVTRLYRELARGTELAAAVTTARRQLADPARRADGRRPEDWFVPALYESRPVRPGSGSSAATVVPRVVDLPGPPAHGFVGRDEVFVELERALTTSPGVVLQAFAGTGKSTVAAEFARWYAATGGCPLAGPLVALRPGESADALAARLAASLAAPDDAGEADPRAGLLDAVSWQRPLMIWDDAQHLRAEHVVLLQELLARGGRAILLTDRPVDAAGLPVLKMPNMPPSEARELAEVVLAAGGAELPVEEVLPLLSFAEGNPLTIVVPMREVARRRLTGSDQVVQLVGELHDRSTPAWATPLVERLALADAPDDVELVAQFDGYVTVPGLVELRKAPDDREGAGARAVLDRLVELGLLALVNRAGVYAIHPALPAATRAARGAPPPGRAFAEAMAAAGGFWAALTEAQGGGAPWLAELDNLHRALRLSIDGGWWRTAAELMLALRSMYGSEPRVRGWRELVLEVAPHFVDVETGAARRRFGWAQSDFAGYLAGLAEADGDMRRALRLRKDDVRRRRAAARKSLAKDPSSWSDRDIGIVRRLATGLTNLGIAYARSHDPAAVACHTEAMRLAHAYGDRRLEALSHLDLGVFHMTVPEARDPTKADAHFKAGFDMTIGWDPQLAAKLLGERGTVHFERALEIAGDEPAGAREELERARGMFERVLEIRGPDAVAAHQLGQIFRQLGDVEESRAWFERAIAFRESDGQLAEAANTRLHLAHALAEAGLLGEAFGYAESALEQAAAAPEAEEWLHIEAERTAAEYALRAAAT